MKQTLVVLVEDKPGVLNRVSSLFRRRNFNIESLTVGHSQMEGVSRMSIVTDEEENLRRKIVESNLVKMVNVIEVDDVTDKPSVQRELALVKVNANSTNRGTIIDTAEKYRGRVVDVGTETMIIEMTGESDRIDALMNALDTFGIVELSRTGVMVMTRGEVIPRTSKLKSQQNGAGH
ncbi:MAG: acetolactate synthase small subunit [Chloroflexota bacterium]